MNQPKRPAAPSDQPNPAGGKLSTKGKEGKIGNGAAAPKGAVPPRGGKGRPKPGQRPKPSATRPRPSTPGTPPAGTSKAASNASGGPQGAAWERRRQQRQRRNIATIASAAVVAVVVALVVIKVVSGSGPANSNPAPAAAVNDATTVPVSALVAAAGSAGAGAINPPIAINPPAPATGKPSILYVGAEYCPYCAAERWPMVMALSQFGKFSGLGATTSSSSDANPNTPTFSFHGASFTSPYLTFTGVEQQNRVGATLDKLTSAQTQVVKKYDAAPYVSAQSAGTIPFVMFGGRYLISGASYDSSSLQNLDIARAAQILSGTADASAASTSKLAAVSIDAKATAAHIVGIVCSLTNNQPAKVCSQVPDSLKQAGAGSSGKGSK